MMSLEEKNRILEEVAQLFHMQRSPHTLAVVHPYMGQALTRELIEEALGNTHTTLRQVTDNIFSTQVQLQRESRFSVKR